MSSQPRTYLRFPLARRIEHIGLMLSFITLAATGLPQKDPSSKISVFIVQALGGIENLRSIHHFHIHPGDVASSITCSSWDTRSLSCDTWSMMLSLQDAKDGITGLLYTIGLQRHILKMGRYTFEEKFDYGIRMGIYHHGDHRFIMWNPITATRYLPGEFVPAAKAAHGGEAVLAVLAIIIWQCMV